MDLLYLEQSNGKGGMEVMKFNVTFRCEVLFICDLCMFVMDLLYHFVDIFQNLLLFHYVNF